MWNGEDVKFLAEQASRACQEMKAVGELMTLVEDPMDASENDFSDIGRERFISETRELAGLFGYHDEANDDGNKEERLDEGVPGMVADVMGHDHSDTASEGAEEEKPLVPQKGRRGRGTVSESDLAWMSELERKKKKNAVYQAESRQRKEKAQKSLEDEMELLSIENAWLTDEVVRKSRENAVLADEVARLSAEIAAMRCL